MTIESEAKNPTEIKQYSFEDGNYSFWEGNVDGKTVVIRVRDDDDAGKRWIEKGLPRGITLHPAKEDNIEQWLNGHHERKLL